MDNATADVMEFHKKFGAFIGDCAKPEIHNWELRKKLITEEWQELQDAVEEGNLPKAADGIVDMIYVLVGTAVEWGIDLPWMWQAVHTSNMTKEGGGTREDGKILKGPNYRPPDLAKELEQQREVYGHYEKKKAPPVKEEPVKWWCCDLNADYKPCNCPT